MSTDKIPALSVSDVKKELLKIYIPMINNNIPYECIATPFLWGSPGIGKSEAVMELAEELSSQTKKQVIVTDIRLLLFSPIDLRGVPVASANHEYTDWLKPRILDLNPSGNVVNILFLDELTAAPQSIQAAAYQITLNRSIGEHKLPDNTIVIAAGNHTTDRSIAYKMPFALSNRMLHFEVKADYDSWFKWAAEHDIHPLVLGYLTYDKSKLYDMETESDNFISPTPRTWTFVSNILKTVDAADNPSDYYIPISGCIGVGAAYDFFAWYKLKNTLPFVDDIIMGRKPGVPSAPDSLYALMGLLTSYVTHAESSSTTESLSDKKINNLCEYLSKVPADYAACFYANMDLLDSVRLKLLKCDVYKQWLKNHRSKLIKRS